MNQPLSDRLLKLGLAAPDILLPRAGSDLSKWAVVACDQYTSEPEYWEDAGRIVGEAPSTLRIIFPEVWLEREDEARKEARIAEINRTMDAYLAQGVLECHPAAFVLTRRTSPDGKVRTGLMTAVDLERYDFSKGSRSLIRATEGTILDRLPPRIRIRENASLETPHIMLLVDDPADTAIGPVLAACEGEAPLYDVALMKNGGRLQGWKVTDESVVGKLVSALEALADPSYFASRYGSDADAGVLLFAVGDGNHSLATARSCWENRKKTLTPEQAAVDPARFALVELVNVHDSGLFFEPIHRVLFGTDADVLSQGFLAACREAGIEAEIFSAGVAPVVPAGAQAIRCCSAAGSLTWLVRNPKQQIDVGTLQVFLDGWLKAHPETAIDYVHGEDVTGRLGSEPGNMGFFLSPMDKSDLFRTVVHDGALPRKTFSMGEAHEKRYYMECRAIRPIR